MSNNNLVVPHPNALVVSHPITSEDSVATAQIRDVAVIIVAGGSGSRTGSDELKQFRWIAGKPMLLHSVQAFQFHPRVAMVIVVLPRSHAADPPPWLFQCDLDRLLVSVGGRERQHSVQHGIEDLEPNIKYVLVHDAARPLVTDSTIDAVIQAATQGKAVVAAIPVVDTLKRVGENGVVSETVDRTNLYRAQTPQGFPREMLERAHHSASLKNIVATDDAALCELIGEKVYLVAGSERAIKVTYESDFALAEALSIYEG